MIKRRHLKQFSGVLEGLLGKINQDCRMDGIEEVLDAGNLPESYSSVPGCFLLGT